MSSPTQRAPARVIGIGASAGGVEALLAVVRGLPAELAHAVCVTLHVSATAPSALPEILNRRCEMRVVAAAHGAPLEAGVVYVAPPDRHLVVAGGRVELTRGPKENGVRPAVDTMLRSIAALRGRGVAVVLSGALGDGSDGADLVLAAGGEVFVQDPKDAVISSMPERTLALVDGGAQILSAESIGRALANLDSDVEQEEVEVPRLETAPEGDRPDGPATGFTCPECHGAIWTVREGDVTRYRCRVGHSYSEEAFVAEQGTAVEAAMWSALEALEERSELLRKIAGRHMSSETLRRQFTDAADEADARAELIRRVLVEDRDAEALAAAPQD
jgi:two-component system, chemotaxis family, protein-glutamate methylesterase/glutaminase